MNIDAYFLWLGHVVITMDFSRENQSVYGNKFFSGINLFYGGIESLWEKHGGN